MNRLVIIRKPTRMSIAPVTSETPASCLRNHTSRWFTAVAPTATRMNGTPRPNRVGEEKDRALADARVQRGQADDAAEDGPDARGPAGGEGHAEERRASIARGLDHDGAVPCRRLSDDPPGRDRDLPVEGRDADDSGDVQAHDDEDGATHLSQDPDVVPQEVSDESDRRPQRDEHHREAENEGQCLVERDSPRRG